MKNSNLFFAARALIISITMFFSTTISARNDVSPSIFSEICTNTETYNQTITLDTIPEASFISPPADRLINCDSAQIFMPDDLFYTNMASGESEISGIVSPTSAGSFDLCGGSVTYTWEFTDVCNRTISHTQMVSVDPILDASFIDPPADMTLQCDEIQTFIPSTLMYTNGGTGSCSIQGTVDPASDGTLDSCGTSILYIWEFTDICGRTISHTQMVNVNDDVLHSVQSDGDKKEIVAFPNPFDNQVTVGEKGLKESDIIIYNLIGENLNSIIGINLSSEKAVIQTTNLPNGIYILKIRSDEKLIYKY